MIGRSTDRPTERTLNCLLSETCTFLKKRSEGFAWKIDRSVICTQLSRFNMRSSFATATSFRKSFGDIDVPFKLIIFFSAKNRRGTFWYKFPVSAKSIPSHSSNILAVDLHPWNTFLHHVKLTADTRTRSSGPRNWNTSGQKNRSSLFSVLRYCLEYCVRRHLHMTEHFIVLFLTVTRLTYFEFAFTRQDLITTCSLAFVFVCMPLCFFIVYYLAAS